MPTIRQIEANRLNAQHSTGPETAQGKAISCRNNLKHGLRAATMVLPFEDREDFDREHQELLDTCQPVGAVEQHYVEQMLDSRWKAVRVNNLIAGWGRIVRGNVKEFAKTAEEKDPTPEVLFQRLSKRDANENLEYLERMQERYDRAYLRAETRLAQIQKERRQREQQVLPSRELPSRDREGAEPEPAPQPVAPEVPAAAPDSKPPAPAATAVPSAPADPPAAVFIPPAPAPAAAPAASQARQPAPVSISPKAG